MTSEIDSSADLNYLLEKIRSNLPSDSIETSRAEAWLLTLLSFYGDQFHILLDLYRLCREKNAHSLLAFLIEYLFQHHSKEIDRNRYLQEEFQWIFNRSSNKDSSTFSYSRLYSLLSSSTRDSISSSLIRQWSNEFEENLLRSTQSIEALNKCREKALACLSLSSSSIGFILQLIISSEEKLGLTTKSTSLNSLRCLFVQDLLPIALENRSRWNIPAHQCHQWLIYAIEFYMEYWLRCYPSTSETNIYVEFEGNHQTFQCDDPKQQIDQLINLAIAKQENFNWQQFRINETNTTHFSNSRQQLLELRLLLDRSSIRCPLECYLFCVSFPIYIQSIRNLSTLLTSEKYKDLIFLYSTKSIETRRKQIEPNQSLDLMENFSLFVQCLNMFQSSPSMMSSLIKLYQEMIEKIHLQKSRPIYQRLLHIFYLYHLREKCKDSKSTKETTTIVIDDTPLSPTMQDETSLESSPLIAPNLENLIEKFQNDSVESRLQLCSLYSLSSSNSRRFLINFCLDTLIELHEKYSSIIDSSTSILFISSDYCFVPRCYSIYFDYILDIFLQYLNPTLILLQLSSTPIYPQELLVNFSPSHLRYIYDSKLLSQLLKYIQTTSTSDRRWTSINSKRKLDDEETKWTDEQLIEKIIQHVSNITQWTDEQRRSTIYSYLIAERQTLLQSNC